MWNQDLQALGCGFRSLRLIRFKTVRVLGSWMRFKGSWVLNILGLRPPHRDLTEKRLEYTAGAGVIRP